MAHSTLALARRHLPRRRGAEQLQDKARQWAKCEKAAVFAGDIWVSTDGAKGRWLTADEIHAFTQWLESKD